MAYTRRETFHSGAKWHSNVPRICEPCEAEGEETLVEELLAELSSEEGHQLDDGESDKGR